MMFPPIHCQKFDPGCLSFVGVAHGPEDGPAPVSMPQESAWAVSERLPNPAAQPPSASLAIAPLLPLPPAQMPSQMDDLGWHYYEQQDWHNAFQAFQTQWLMGQKQMDPVVICEALINIGQTAIQMGAVAQAPLYLHDALKIAEAIEHLPLQGRGAQQLGHAARRAQIPLRAVQYYRLAAYRFAAAHDDRAVAEALVAMAQAYGDLGCLDRTYQFCAIALDLLQEVHHPVCEVEALYVGGQAAHALDDADTAIAWLEKAVAIQIASDDRAGEARTRCDLAKAYGAQGDLRSALSCWWDALLLFRELGDRPSQWNALIYLGIIYEKSDMALSALDAYRQATELIQAGLGSDALDPVLLGMAQRFERLGEPDQALDCYRQLIELFDEL